MRIGTLELPPGAGLAPMAGVTDCPMRRLCFEMGAAWAVTEMLSAKGYVCAPQGTRAMDSILARGNDEGVLGLQLFGNDPVFMEEAARRLSRGRFDFIDINLGCPAHKIVGNGEGSALMRDPERARQVIRAAVRSSRLPVTVKIRSGWDEYSVNAPQIARIAQDEGAAAVTVHARTRAQMYAGRADRHVIAEVKRAVSIPVIGNGDVRSAEDYFAMIRETGCDGVAVGRGAQGNPWVFAQILAAVKGEPWAPPSPAERISLILRHARMQADWLGEPRAMREMRKHVAWSVQGMPGAARVRERVNSVESFDALEQLLTDYLRRLS